MTMVMTMTSKDLHIAIKRNDGMEYLLNRFSFQEENQLFDTIRKIVPSKADDFIKTLKKKQKKFCSRVKTTQSQVLPEKQESSHSDVMNEEIIQNPEEKEVDVSPKPTLEQFLSEEKKISSIICRIEGEHKNFVAQRRMLVDKLETSRLELKKIKRLLEEQQEIVTKTYEEFQECASLMEILNEEKNAYEKQLKEIRSEIENLKKITIFVYQDGSIETENMPIEYIEESSITNASRQLYDLSAAEELTIKEIKTIAKLQIVVDMMEKGGYKTEIIFDSTRVRKFWETVRA